MIGKPFERLGNSLILELEIIGDGGCPRGEQLLPANCESKGCDCQGQRGDSQKPNTVQRREAVDENRIRR